MDALRRTIGTLFIPSGFHRSLLLSTYEDVFAAEEGEIEAVVQGLLGCDPKLNGNASTEMLMQRLRENWTWKVVLKVLLVLHRLIVSPCATRVFLKGFLQNIDTFTICQSFREGEGTDAQAESHTQVIRKYAFYLNLLSSELIKQHPRYSKDMRFDSAMFKEYDEEELFSLIQFYSTLLRSCFALYVTVENKVFVINGFCELTATVALFLLKDVLHIYKILSLAGLELLNRYPQLHPDDIQIAEDAYEAYRISSDQMQTFLEFVKNLPELGRIELPRFQTPPAAPELHCRKPTDNRFAILSSSSSDSDRRHLRHKAQKARNVKATNKPSQSSQSQSSLLDNTRSSAQNQSTGILLETTNLIDISISPDNDGINHGNKEKFEPYSNEISPRTSSKKSRHRRRRRSSPSSSSDSNELNRCSRDHHKSRRKQSTSSLSSLSSTHRRHSREKFSKENATNKTNSISDVKHLNISQQHDNDILIDLMESPRFNPSEPFRNEYISISSEIPNLLEWSDDNKFKLPSLNRDKSNKKTTVVKPITSQRSSSTISSIPLPLYPHPTNLAATTPEASPSSVVPLHQSITQENPSSTTTTSHSDNSWIIPESSIHHQQTNQEQQCNKNLIIIASNDELSSNVPTRFSGDEEWDWLNGEPNSMEQPEMTNNHDLLL